MLKLNSLQASSDFPFQPSLFAKPPFRQYFFIGDTVLFILSLSILGFVIVGYWPRLTTVSVFWLGLVGFSMVAIWVLALKCYRRIHEIFRQDEASFVSDGSPIGIAMSSAAGMIHWGLFFSYMMTTGVLMQLAKVLSNR